MKIMRVFAVVCCLNGVIFAGDTNFVVAFKVMWQTRNASNILEFVEQNVATNASPETLFARGGVASTLQFWSQGMSNYWEQAMQMIATNNAYSEIGRTNAIRQVSGLRDLTLAMTPYHAFPSWKTNAHAAIFAELGDEAPYFDVLQSISTIDSAEE